MSAKGQKQTCAAHKLMSALGQKRTVHVACHSFGIVWKHPETVIAMTINAIAIQRFFMWPHATIRSCWAIEIKRSSTEAPAADRLYHARRKLLHIIGRLRTVIAFGNYNVCHGTALTDFDCLGVFG